MSLPPEHSRALLLTARVAPDDLAPFTALRDRFFPPARNYLPAHITLFHQLPQAALDELTVALAAGVAATAPFTVGVLPPVSLGRGVAYPVEARRLQQLRRPLRERFDPLLTEQDRRPWKRPHLTVQNKVTVEEARRLLRHLTYRYRSCQLRIEGLEVHRYDGGPWTLLATHLFPPAAPPPVPPSENVGAARTFVEKQADDR